MKKSRHILSTICRVLLGLLFIFSGFTKGVDPMGSALKFGEYFNYFGFDFLKGSETFFAIALSTGEMVLGFMLVLGLRLRVTGAIVSIFMLFFTLFTLFIALTHPVADCGCFGDAIKMSNWGSFYKNMLVLFPLSLVVMFNAWTTQPRRGKWLDFLWAGLFGAVACSISLHAYHHLPLIDFLPYKIGVNIPRLIDRGNETDDQTKLLYRDLKSGRVVEFAMSDTTWYDSTRWEYVDTVVPGRHDQGMHAGSNFAIMDGTEDVTARLLEPEGVLFILCVSQPAELGSRCAKPLADAAREAMARGYRVIAVTPHVSLGKKQTMLIDEDVTVDYYNIDDVTLKSLLRAPSGLVVLRDGTIVDKMHCNDIPRPGEFPDFGR